MFQALRYWTLGIALLVLETTTGALSFLASLLTTTASFLSGPGLFHTVKTHVESITHSEQEQELLPSKSGVGGEV